MGCCNNGWGGGGCLWIVILIIIIFCCCGGGCGNSAPAGSGPKKWASWTGCWFLRPWC